MKKAGTPTMGGIAIILAILATTLPFAHRYPNVIPILYLTLAFGVVARAGDIGAQARIALVENPDIPWSQIAGLRHRLVHNYEGTNWSIVAAVVFDELETFIRQIEAMIVADDEVSPTEIETANR